jgi:hypothetical protein
LWIGKQPELQWRRALHGATLTVLLLLVFKAGYVRHDEHEIIATGVLPPAVVIYLAATLSKNLGKPSMLAWAICLLAAMHAASYSYARFAQCNLLERIARSVYRAGEEITETGSLLAGRPPTVAESYQKLAADTARAAPLPKVEGSTDLYTMFQHRVVFNGLDYLPRPALQGYAAYTPRLAEADAAFLRSPRGPANLFFAFEAIDGRLPTLEDGRSLLELPCQYDLLAGDGPYLQFRRAAAPRSYTLQPIGQQRAAFAEAIAIPATANGSLVWAVIDLQPSLLGRLVAGLYKPPPLTIELTTSDGRKRRARFIASCARSGFVMSPLFLNNAGLASACTPRPAMAENPPRVASFRIGGADGIDPSDSYDEAFDVQLFEVTYSQ